MKQFEFKLPKGNALPLGNGLRQVALSRIPAWRPVAFSLDRKINILDASSDIVEDTVSILANIAQFKYIPKGQLSGSFLKEKFVFTKALKSSDMRSEFFDIVGGDQNLITSLGDREVTLTILYRYAHGFMDTQENSRFLSENMEKPGDYMIMSSRHTNVVNFAYDILDSSLQEEKLVLTIESDTADEETVLVESIQGLKDSVLQLERSVREMQSNA